MEEFKVGTQEIRDIRLSPYQAVEFTS